MDDLNHVLAVFVLDGCTAGPKKHCEVYQELWVDETVYMRGYGLVVVPQKTRRCILWRETKKLPTEK